jgi:hypothetical protein
LRCSAARCSASRRLTSPKLFTYSSAPPTRHALALE